MLQILWDIIEPAFRQLLESGIDGPSYSVGFGAGCLAAGLMGVIFQRILSSWARRRLPDRPMAVPTHGTPRDVMNAAAGALRSALGWGMLLILVGLAIIFASYLFLQLFGNG